MSPRHTPGPWKAVPYAGVAGFAVMARPDPAGDGIVVPGVTGSAVEDPEGRRAEVEANADLAAAAPSLFLMLRAIERGVGRIDGLEFCALGVRHLLDTGSGEPLNLDRRSYRAIEAAVLRAEGGER